MLFLCMGYETLISTLVIATYLEHNRITIFRLYTANTISWYQLLHCAEVCSFLFKIKSHITEYGELNLEFA